MSVNFEYFRIFYTVAKHQNITRAAEELCLSRPTVAQELQKMESQTGMTLFDRHSRGVTFTQEGKNLFYRIRPAVQILQDAEREIEVLGRLKTAETINISFTRPHTLHAFQQIFAGFHEEYPHIVLKTSVVPFELAENALNSGFTELSFGARHDYHPSFTKDNQIGTASSDISEFSIGMFEDVVIVHEHLAHLAETPQRLHTLAKYQFIFYKDRAMSGMEHYLARINQSQAEKERNLFLGEVDAIFNLLKYSDSIAIIPSFHLHELDRSFVRLKIVEPIIHTEYMVQYSKKKQPSPAALKLISYLQQYNVMTPQLVSE